MKKGFTLIEILSVIIILGIIFLFITPKISNLIKDSRNLSKEIEEITIINSVKEYASAYEKDFYSSFLDVGDKGYILVSDIVSKGNISKEEIEDYGVIDTDYVEVELVENDKFIYKFVSNMDTITVKFDLNDGVMEDKYIKVRYNETYGELPIPVKNGYTFAGWYKEKELNNKVVSSTIVKDKKTHVLYAKWVETVKLEVNLNGGSTTQDFEEKYAPNTEIKLISPTKKGYTFTGWQIVSGDSILSGDNLTIGSVNTVIKATYSPITYTINYNVVNDSSGNSYPNIGTYDSMLTIKNPSRTGYTFDGWMATNIDTTTAKYGTTSPNKIWNGTTKVKDIYFINLRSSAGTVTMNANYTATSQTLTVNLNGGTTSQSFKGTYKTNEVITLINPTRAGYTFTGWSVTSGNSILSGNTLTMGSENTTITANWKASTTIPMFTYTGNCEIVDDSDNVLSDTTTCGKSISSTESTWTGNWKIRFLTSGTLTFTTLNGASNGIDAFLVGGGGNGGPVYAQRAGRYGFAAGGGGGGGGYRTTQKGISVSTSTNYSIIVGAAKGTSSAFGYSAAGGKDGGVATGLASVDQRAQGGSGGAVGGLGGLNAYSGENGAIGGYEFGETSGKLYGSGGGGGHGHNGATSSIGKFGYGGSTGAGNGNGQYWGYPTQHNATANTGSGGGGASYFFTQEKYPDYSSSGHTYIYGITYPAGTGASGIVIIRNKR